jgi:predicted transcriptional regulator
MYIADELSFRSSRIDQSGYVEALPSSLELLYPRERQIAEIVYRRGVATAADVQIELSGDLSNPAIRSMLNRLVNKNILTRVRCGRHGTYVYSAALTQASAKELALRQFAKDFYGGSLSALAMAIGDLFASQPSFRWDQQIPSGVSGPRQDGRDIGAVTAAGE